MDFYYFEKLACKQYDLVCEERRRCGDNYPLPFEEVMAIFETFFAAYRKQFHNDHPNISAVQVREIIRKIPWIDEEAGCLSDVVSVDASVYEVIIAQYFKTHFCNCDYRINHFFSGQIRALRCFETYNEVREKLCFI